MAVQWLSSEQQRHWRAYLVGTTLLFDTLERDLRDKHGLSLPEYELLVRLSEAPGRALRMAELADSVKNSRSRITHTVKRLEADGLIERRSCESDGRGVLAALTEAGYEKLAMAAPDHVDSVRRALVDGLSDEELEAIGRAFARLRDRLESTGASDSLSATCDPLEA